MTLKDAVAEVKRAAKRSGYKGELTNDALEECARVYLENCDADGTPRPRLYLRSGEKHRPTNLTEIQWLLVRTPSFKRWFGKSVIVDENGDPKVMYHGAWEHFNEFKTSFIKLSKTAMTLWSGPGFYFTDQEKVAKIYAGGANNRIYDVFLRLENPLVVDETGNAVKGCGISRKDAERIFLDGDNTQWLDVTLAAELARMDEEAGGKGKGKQYYRSLTRPERVRAFVSRLKTDVVTLKTAAQAYGAKSQNRLLASICKHTGYDGVIHTLTPDVKEWVIYDPKSIKSASENTGDFAPDKAKVQDAAVSSPIIPRHNLEEKGNSRMVFKSLIDSLTKLCSNPAADHAVAEDIVDRNGRHHEPKGVPPGGQFENEGQYATTAKAKQDYYHKKFAQSDSAKKMREHCAQIMDHIDASKLGNDTAKHYYKQQVHKYADMTKQSVLAGANQAYEDMKKHAKTYSEIKRMSKEDFTKWVEEHPEYNNGQMQNLLTNPAYNKKFKIKNEAGEYVEQDHEAWEEAKLLVARRATASMIDYMAHIEALNNTPDGMIDSYLKGAGSNSSHKAGHEDYAKVHGIKHGEGENAGKVTMSEIQAAESELSKANADLKEDESQKPYMHALSHFLGKDGGLRDPNGSVDGVLKKVQARIDAKKNAWSDACNQHGDDSEEASAAAADYYATKKAADVVHKILGKDGEPAPAGENPQVGNTEPPKPIDEPKKPTDNAPSDVGQGVPTQAITQKPKQVLNEKATKYMNGLGDYVKSDLGKKYAALVDSDLTAEEKGEHQKTIEANAMSENAKLLNQLHTAANEAKGKGDKAAIRKALAKYHMTAEHLYKQLSSVGKEDDGE